MHEPLQDVRPVSVGQRCIQTLLMREQKVFFEGAKKAI